MTARIVRCRMLNAKNDQCTAQALDEQGEVLICQRHAALVLELIQTRKPSAEDARLMVEIHQGLVDVNTMLKDMAQ